MDTLNKTNPDDGELVGADSFVEEIVVQCRALLKYSLEKGLVLEHDQVYLLESKTFNGTMEQLLDLYNYLVALVKPANPKTIWVMEKCEDDPKWLRMLGPLPVVRQFTALAIISLLVLIATSLSPLVSVNTIQLSMLQGHGWEQVYRLMFLLACASVGGSFYALFKINSYLCSETFIVALSHTYWNRYVLGLVSGLMLSELFVGMVDPTTTTSSDADPLNSVGYLLKPILAILGGFSADLVYRVLNRLVGTIESLFKGDAKEAIAQKEWQFRLQAKESATKVKNTATQQLLSLKQAMVKANVSDEVLEQLDGTLDDLAKGE